MIFLTHPVHGIWSKNRIQGAQISIYTNFKRSSSKINPSGSNLHFFCDTQYKKSKVYILRINLAIARFFLHFVSLKVVILNFLKIRSISFWICWGKMNISDELETCRPKNGLFFPLTWQKWSITWHLYGITWKTGHYMAKSCNMAKVGTLQWSGLQL